MGDDELVLQAQAGDTAAFDVLVERHHRRIYGTVARMTGDRELALDLTQDAFVRAWERIATFERRSAFSTWLYRIAVRLTYDALEHRSRRPVRALDERLPDPGTAPDEHAARSAVTRDLRTRIAELPEMQRAIVVMRTYEELPYREIATILGTTENSARVSFHHAVRKLRDALEGHG